MPRPNCPACGCSRRTGHWSMDYIVPDGWTLPTHNDIYLCQRCGLIYYDNDRTQADYDRYYKERYGFDGNLDPEKHAPRLNEIVELVKQTEHDKRIRIVDFGGGNGYVTKKLREGGYTDVTNIEVGDLLPNHIDLLISNHVFEHIYDLKETVERLVNHMALTGRFLVELPDACQHVYTKELPLLDYHQVHINHFVPATLDKLFYSFGYYPIYSIRKVLAYHNAPMYRAIYLPHVPYVAYCNSQTHVQKQSTARLAKLRALTGPLIVWGCGAYCLHMLALAPAQMANVVLFVDQDPAFRGATIRGVPVLDHVEGDAPILVIAQQQATGILDAIKKAGLQNEVITI